MKTINYNTFYRSTIWRSKRKEILKRDNNECQRCKSNGRYSKADCVHHIKFLKDRPDLALVDSNLLSVCDICHNILHPEKLHNNDVVKRVVSEEKW
ncbi:HNH endonuclease [Pelosinus baikalensis]|uniref:Putative HNH nuclease YajD n=1 Tax=Pelosinus baikalensis TaxID=2892015 RepID=A0ABS8HSQ0_9FIRM|nr:HNH endonuclease [Pelosinus baikalensis]